MAQATNNRDALDILNVDKINRVQYELGSFTHDITNNIEIMQQIRTQRAAVTQAEKEQQEQALQIHQALQLQALAMNSPTL